MDPKQIDIINFNKNLSVLSEILDMRTLKQTNFRKTDMHLLNYCHYFGVHFYPDSDGL